MQTFLPYSDFKKSAKCLDYKRLGKQRIEAKQIFQALEKGPCTKGRRATPWYNHPATQQWKGAEYWLLEYGIAMCDEWIARGYKDTTRPVFLEYKAKAKLVKKPDWIRDQSLQSGHRGLLYRKDPSYYSQFEEYKDNPFKWGKI